MPDSKTGKLYLVVQPPLRPSGGGLCSNPFGAPLRLTRSNELHTEGSAAHSETTGEGTVMRKPVPRAAVMKASMIRQAWPGWPNYT